METIKHFRITTSTKEPDGRINFYPTRTVFTTKEAADDYVEYIRAIHGKYDYFVTEEEYNLYDSFADFEYYDNHSQALSVIAAKLTKGELELLKSSIDRL